MNSPWAITYPFPPAPQWPLGPCSPLGSTGLVATFVVYPTPYVIVAVDPRIAEKMDLALEAGRVQVARDTGLRCSPTVPKLAALAASSTSGADLVYRTRMGMTLGWHPKVASSGLLALAVAVATPNTVPWLLLGGQRSEVRVATRAGVRRIGLEAGAAGSSVRLCLGEVTVDRPREQPL